LHTSVTVERRENADTEPDHGIVLRIDARF